MQAFSLSAQFARESDMLKLPEERRRWGESKGAPSLKGYYFYSPQSSTVIKSKMAATTILRTRTRFFPPKIRLQCRLIRTFLVQIGKNAKNKARADKDKHRFITLLHFLYMAVNRIVTLLFYCLELYFSCILVRVRVQFYFERVHYLFLYLIDVYISLINVLILLCVIFLTYMCCP